MTFNNLQKRQHSEIHQSSEYISDYETDTGSIADTTSQISGASDLGDGNFAGDIGEQPPKRRFSGQPPNSLRHILDDELRREHNAITRHHMVGINAYDRHKKLVNDYIQYYGGSWKDFKRDGSTDRHDMDVIREHSRFLWCDKDEPTSWSERFAKRYWDKLFKEYCLVDLSRYKENKFGMRWRIEKEVISGKGQFACGNVACSVATTATTEHSTEQPVKLRSWEVNFAYKERGERRHALVKVRLCPACSGKLNYHRRSLRISDVSMDSLTHRMEYRHSERHREWSSQSTASTYPRGEETEQSSPTNAKLQESGQSEQRTDANVWQSSSSTTSTAPKTTEEEFDAYFADLLM